MRINKPTPPQLLDDVVEVDYTQPKGELRLLIDGNKTLISGDSSYPHEIIYDRPVRVVNVLRYLTPMSDIVTKPNTTVTLIIPPVVHLESHISTITYEVFNVDTDTTVTVSGSNTLDVVSPPLMHQEHIYLIRAVGNGDTYGDYITMRVRSEALGYLSVTSTTSSLPEEVIEESESTFTITCEYASDLSDTSNLRIRILRTHNITINAWNDIELGADIPFIGGSLREGGWIEFLVEDLSGYESQEQRIDFTIVPNMPPLIDGLIHNLPQTALKEQIIPFTWTNVVDPEEDTIFLVITRIVGGDCDMMNGIPIDTQAVITPHDPGTGTISISWKLYDGRSYSNEQRHVIVISGEVPNMDNMVLTLNGVPAADVIITPCEIYTVNITGITVASGEELVLHLTGPSTITYDVVTAQQGVDFTMDVGCETRTHQASYVSVTAADSSSDNTRIVSLNILPVHGHATITNQVIFDKPAGVTQMIVMAQGGRGEDTTITGSGLSATWIGASSASESLPEFEDRLIIDLPPSRTPYTVTPATDATVYITW